MFGPGEGLRNTTMIVYQNIHNTKIRTGLILSASGLVIFAGGFLYEGGQPWKKPYCTVNATSR